MSELYQQPTHNISSLFGKKEDITKLYDDEVYTAYTEDLEFMWRWTIYREEQLVQEGCSLTEDASRHAVDHVMAFFNSRKKRNKLKWENHDLWLIIKLKLLQKKVSQSSLIVQKMKIL